MDSHEMFLNGFYETAKVDAEAAIDQLFNLVDDLLCAGSYDLCDNLLQATDVTKINTSLLRGFLVITAAAKERLPSRRDFFSRAYAETVRQRGPELAKRIMHNLE